MKRRTNNAAWAAIILALSLVFAFTVSGIHHIQEKAELAAAATEPSEPPTEAVTAPPTEATEPEDTGWKSPPSIKKAPEGYFKTALFIGDSRTVGLAAHGGLTDASFFASEGLSIWSMRTEKIDVKDVGIVTLSELFAQKEYETIYLMSGINELGSDLDASIEEYKEFVQWLREKQPNAVIIVQANLHVSQQKSGESRAFNNDRIRRFNDAIRSLEDGWHIFYLDVNELFDDAAGYLDAGYTSDGVHPYGKYYISWGNWLKERAIVQSK